MLINRKRSARKGPTYRQTYVPHDQRQLNTEPTPIMDEKSAQYYYNQLLTKGYINANPYIVVIKNKDPLEHVVFEINTDLTIGDNGNINSTDMQILDIYGNPYKTPLISNADILNRVGVKLSPILAIGKLGVYNATASRYQITFKDMDTSSTSYRDVEPESYNYITDYFTYFDAASISVSGSYMYYTLRKPDAPYNNFDVMYCFGQYFYLVCDELAVLVYPA